MAWTGILGQQIVQPYSSFPTEKRASNWRSALHIDQYSAQVLADIGWDDYSLGAKTMALGIPLHQGTMGWWNLVLPHRLLRLQWYRLLSLNRRKYSFCYVLWSR
jgi:uncharacterized iron-regulated membrane protein